MLSKTLRILSLDIHSFVKFIAIISFIYFMYLTISHTRFNGHKFFIKSRAKSYF
jgi:hypothetical protein